VSDLKGKKKDMIEALTKSAGNVSAACKMVGVSRQTHYAWLDKSDTYKKEYGDSLEQLKDFVETELLKNIKGGSVAAQIFWLKTKAKDRGYVERVELDASEGFVPVQIVLPDNGRVK